MKVLIKGDWVATPINGQMAEFYNPSTGKFLLGVLYTPSEWEFGEIVPLVDCPQEWAIYEGAVHPDGFVAIAFGDDSIMIYDRVTAEVYAVMSFSSFLRRADEREWEYKKLVVGF